jgi:nucleoside-diphosphate-sugar epimerase
MRIAVTGASGFIGGAVARDLVVQGHEVIGFGRRPDAFHEGRYRMWHLTSGPLANAPTVDAVVHAAALADDWASLEDATAVNVQGTQWVIDAFPGARFVHLSSSSVYDAYRPTVNAVETARIPRRFLSTYSRTKAESETLFAGQNAAILRPHAVYGAGDTTLLPRLRAAFENETLTLPAGGKVLHTLTSIDNLVRAVGLAIQPGAASGVFNVGDAEPVLLATVVAEILRKKTGRDVRVRSTPYSVAYAGAAAAERIARSRGLRPSVTRYAVSQLGRERTLDLTAAQTRLGYEPTPTSLEGAEAW